MNRGFLSLSFLLASVSVTAATLPPAHAKHAMVVTAQRDATEVGVNVLKQGGNAIDAAVAVGYALAVVHPCCGNIGGGGFMLIRFKDGKSTFINFRERAPLALKREMLLDDKGNIKYAMATGHTAAAKKVKKPYLAVGTPGTVMGLNTALQRYGTMPLIQTLQPAIRLAEHGYAISPSGAFLIGYGAKTLRHDTYIAGIFLRHGKAPMPGEMIVQKDLAKTLRQIAQGGTAAFYEGDIARAVATAAAKEGALLSQRDFKEYTVTEYTPIHCSYHGYDIMTSPPPSAGGIAICQTLNVLSVLPIKQMGFHSAAASHYTVEAMRYAFADRNTHIGDPDFVNNPTEKLISTTYANEIRNKIQANKATDSNTIGITTPQVEGQNTTSYVIVDKYGNAVSVTYSINHMFGAKVMAGNTGFFLNNELDDFALVPGVPNAFKLVQGEANLIAPGKRPVSSMAPTIITKDGKLFMVLGTSGGSTIPTQLIQVIQNVVDFDMNIQQAINAPRFHMQWQPDNIFMEPFTFSTDTQKVLISMGHQLKLGSPYGTKRWGAVSAIQIDLKTGMIYGAMDARRPTGLAKGN